MTRRTLMLLGATAMAALLAGCGGGQQEDGSNSKHRSSSQDGSTAQQKSEAANISSAGACNSKGSTDRPQQGTGEVSNGQIAFQRFPITDMLLPPYEEIYAIDEDGTDERCLAKIVPRSAWVTTPGYRTMAWSPDGQKIAFEGLHDGKRYDVYVMDADGTHEMRLTDGPTPTDGRRYPAWSPDGEQIAFVGGGALDEIYAIDKDGTDETRLTKSDSDPETETYASVGDPVWSPDGNKIAFGSSATRTTYPDSPESAAPVTAPAAGIDGLYVIDMETGGLRKLTGAEPSNISWSPDGNKIAFYEEKTISVINADGTGRKELTRGYSPTWSPDSNKIAFTEISDKPAINLINADGSGREELTDTEGAGAPFWSPDGEQIAFVKHADLYVINADGTGLKRLASKLAPKDVPVSVSWGRG